MIKYDTQYELELVSYLESRYDKKFVGIKIIEKLDLDTLNHLSGKLTKYLKISFNKYSD